MAGGVEETLWTTLLDWGRERGLGKAWGTQRTVSTHVLAALHIITCMEWVGEPLHAVLQSLATVVPAWITARAPIEWDECSEMHRKHFLLPNEKSTHEDVADQIGRDVWSLLHGVCEEKTLPWLKEIPAVEVVRRVWLQLCWTQERHSRWRFTDNCSPASQRISSPSAQEDWMGLIPICIPTYHRFRLA
jgi:transposase